jgi:hypothetical protein
VYIQYRGPTRALDAKTPFEVWHGERPHVHYLRTFGCLAYVKNTRPGLNKLDDRNTRVIFVGYEIGSKAYRFYNPNTERIIISRDAVFDEAGEWKWNEDDAADAVQPEPFVIEYTEEYTKPTGTGETRGRVATHSDTSTTCSSFSYPVRVSANGERAGPRQRP